jgi:hypothetical protein
VRKKHLTILAAVLATAMFVVPGIAFGGGGHGHGGGGGGNGTVSPPPSNPPCDADHHSLMPAFLQKHKQCNGSTSGSTTGKSTTNGTTTPPCDRDNHLAKGKPKKCRTSTSTTSPSTTTTTTGGEDACETNGVLGPNSLDIGGPSETLADLLVDNGLPLHEPEVGPGGGTISEPVYEFVAPILPPVTPGVAAEATCAVNLLGL